MTEKAMNDDLHAMQRILTIMAKLRDPMDGCPWDLEQDFASIAPYTIEEAYEVADAIERSDMAALVDELGDLLLQVVFHAQMGRDTGQFIFADVANSISDKMERRHPHVFGGTVANTPDAVTANWEAIKAAERGAAASALDGVALALPALMRAEKLQKRAARTGFDWPDAQGATDKIHEELAELQAADGADAREEELGDLLFSVVNLARFMKIDPEVALRKANMKFGQRFRAMEAKAAAEDKDFAALPLDDKEALWQAGKHSS
jgi:nucleoside triphosphate diphosphatase